MVISGFLDFFDFLGMGSAIFLDLLGMGSDEFLDFMGMGSAGFAGMDSYGMDSSGLDSNLTPLTGCFPFKRWRFLRRFKFSEFTGKWANAGSA